MRMAEVERDSKEGEVAGIGSKGDEELQDVSVRSNFVGPAS